MILKGVEAARYFAKPDATKAGLLIFGADGMRVALRRQEVVAALIGPEGPAEMRLTRMAASDLRKEGGALSDAMRAMGFFPGPRVVLVEDATDTLSDTVAAALKDWRAGDAQVVVTAGGLTAKSTLKALFDKHPAAICIGLYDEPPSREEIEATLQKAGLTKIDPDAQADLGALARMLEPGDFRQMLDKIALYKLGDATPLSGAEVAAMAPLTVEAEVTDLVQAVAERRVRDVGTLIRRLEGQGVQPVALCIGALRHFRNLHAMACDPAGASVAAQRSRGNFRQKDAVQTQLRIWDSKALESALAELVETDLTLRSSSRAPGMAVVERALLRLAMVKT
jgi:DNA polymerase III subunit delta